MFKFNLKIKQTGYEQTLFGDLAKVSKAKIFILYQVVITTKKLSYQSMLLPESVQASGWLRNNLGKVMSSGHQIMLPKNNDGQCRVIGSVFEVVGDGGLETRDSEYNLTPQKHKELT